MSWLNKDMIKTFTRTFFYGKSSVRKSHVISTLHGDLSGLVDSEDFKETLKDYPHLFRLNDEGTHYKYTDNGFKESRIFRMGSMMFSILLKDGYSISVNTVDTKDV